MHIPIQDSKSIRCFYDKFMEENEHIQQYKTYEALQWTLHYFQ